jgi:hypothetical protein
MRDPSPLSPSRGRLAATSASLRETDVKGVSDSEYVLLVGEKGDYPHRAFAARTPERINLKDALHAARPGAGSDEFLNRYRTPTNLTSQPQTATTQSVS